MKTAKAFLYDVAHEDDFNELKGEIKGLISGPRVVEYMYQFAEACIKEDRQRIKKYLELYPEANPELAPPLSFRD
jgi:hypothetical protein